MDLTNIPSGTLISELLLTDKAIMEMAKLVFSFNTSTEKQKEDFIRNQYDTFQTASSKLSELMQRRQDFVEELNSRGFIFI